MKRIAATALLALLFSFNLANADEFCGKYRVLVVDDNDPLLQGRVKVEIFTPTANLYLWAVPNVPFGKVRLPAIGDQVWISFEKCNSNFPIWEGSPVVQCKLGKHGDVGGCETP